MAGCLRALGLGSIRGMNIGIRRACSADLGPLAAFEQQLFEHEAYPSFFFRQALELWPEGLWLADGGAQGVAGYALAALASAPGDAWLLSMAVHPQHRGQGLAARLLAPVVDASRRTGCRALWLTVHPDNAPARAAYRRAGFVDDSLVDDYFGPGQPRWRMRKTID